MDQCPNLQPLNAVLFEDKYTLFGRSAVGEVIDKMKNTATRMIVGATHYSFVTTEAVEFALKKGSRFCLFNPCTYQRREVHYVEREFIKNRPKAYLQKIGETIA